MSRPTYTIRHLRYFVSAAKQLSIAKAASQEVVSPTSIVHALEVLESILKEPLFIRQRSKGLTLTPRGVIFLREVEDLLAATDAFDDRIMQRPPQESVELKIGFFEPFSATLMPDILSGILEHSPDTRFNLQAGHSVEVISLLTDGKVDVAITYDVIPAPPQFTSEPLARVQMLALLPADHPLAQHTSLHLAQLADYPMIHLNLPNNQIIHGFLAAFGFQPNIVHRCQRFDLLCELVARGQGYGLGFVGVPGYRQRLADDITSVEIIESFPMMQTVAMLPIARRSTHLQDAIDLFLKVARETAGAH